MSNKTVMFDDWPTIEFPEFLRGLGFEDRSWHNDLCARAQKPLPGYDEEKGFPMLVCWVEHKDPGEREAGGPRYELVANLTCDILSDTGVALYQGDDDGECERAVRLALVAVEAQDGVFIMGAENSPEAEQTLKQIFKR